MNRQQLQDIFRQSYNSEQWQELLIKLFGATEIRTTPAELEGDNNKYLKGLQLGELTTADRYSIGLFAFEVSDTTRIEMNRIGLRSLVRSYTKYQYDAALTIYYNSSQWRLSFICDLRGENTAPKRYTYVFGNSAESYRTAAERLIKLYDTSPTFEAIKDAFSVEQLSKDFFKEYKQQYAKFIAYIGDNKSNRDYVKKMLGRLVFLQFLQKKGWLACPASNSDWSGGDLQYLQNLIARYDGCDRLLSDVLEVLFFDTLNTKREGDIASSILGDNIKIPYLNGGLFDRDTLDNKDIDFPYAYFVELMEFFSHYNFTIDENDPYDAEVGVDPEMLGHIFENLLEDNKDKGAFYTPKEIVQYMCRQSLIEYLQSKLGKSSAVEAFVNRHDVSDKFIIDNATEIEKLLDSVQICDPAIGSGAFPMGILNEVFHCKMALDLTLNRAEVKKNIIQNSIYGVDIEQGAVDIARLRFWLSLVVEENEPQPLPNLDYKIMCGNSLLSRYALDVPIDEVFAEYNKTNKTNFTLSDYKALVADYTTTSNKSQKADFRTKIEEIKSAFTTSLDGKLITKRIKLQVRINSLRSDNLFGKATKSDLKEAKELDKKLKVMLQNEEDIKSNRLYKNAFEWRFEFPALLADDGSFVGFDIVIGNPPYVVESLPKIMESNYSTSTTKELYSFFYERAIKDLLTDGGVIAYITGSLFIKGLKFKVLRDFLVENISKPIIAIAGDDVFEKVNMPTSILISSKKGDKTWNFNEFSENNKIISGIEFGTVKLSTITSIQRGFEIGKKITYFGECGINFITGEDISKFSIDRIRKISHDTFSVYSKSDYFYEGDRLLIRETGSMLTSLYLSEKLYCNRSLYSIKITDANISPKYLLAILNSSLMQLYYASKYKSDTNIFPKIRIAQVKELPVKIIPVDEQIPYMRLVDRIIEAKRQVPQADTTALEAEIDIMVYDLYNLSKEEIAIIEN